MSWWAALLILVQIFILLCLWAVLLGRSIRPEHSDWECHRVRPLWVLAHCKREQQSPALTRQLKREPLYWRRVIPMMVQGLRRDFHRLTKSPPQRSLGWLYRGLLWILLGTLRSTTPLMRISWLCWLAGRLRGFWYEPMTGLILGLRRSRKSGG